MGLMTANAPASSATSRQIKVMVVDDSVVIRGLIGRWVNDDPDLTLVGSHRNGRLAVEDVAKSKPDIVVLDIEMPDMDGLTALPQLLRNNPTSKIIMASTLTRRNAEISLRAMSLGATDYVPKPESNSQITTSKEFRVELLEKIKAIGGVPDGGASGFRASRAGPLNARGAAQPTARTQHSRQSLAKSGTKVVQATPEKAASATASGIQLRKLGSARPRALLIGSSTGGPQALEKLLHEIGPQMRSAPILITQHMPATFTAILAEHLARSSGMPAAEAQDGEAVQNGHIYVAPGGKHMLLTKKAGQTFIKLTDTPPVNFCKPAVDPLFETASEVYGSAILAVVLTGMGHDGAAGAKFIVDAGGSVIAQDEATSVVWGMPGAAAQAGVCAAVLPLNQIGSKVLRVFRGERS
ncbi:two-component system, chemotaxis family, response regulator CheB [Cohaesibacter sp. ES.047]|uniref:protein-glutamate methylesterase/protein-glutamine glutaminase n=1 Tax=Cohaesibacter sp. ES.047 TaxID=1798205 RepID=UPI000BB8A3BB|nr:chemotaxis response regulator protein-glutamate methylesterase [Cohaesibacter sp. ES.047]SNY91103.1 two-component system, chemotaxis family, response regulator CheB [Cohaesibacter sp. ES.047]